MARAPGFYWVRYTGRNWQIASWSGSFWYLAGDDCAIRDSEMEEINENRLVSPDN